MPEAAHDCQFSGGDAQTSVGYGIVLRPDDACYVYVEVVQGHPPFKNLMTRFLARGTLCKGERRTMHYESSIWSHSNPCPKSWETSMEEFGGALTVLWKSFFQSKSVCAMIYAHVFGSWGYYCCLSWLPTYFRL
ncbi:hypothetical protein L1987_57912 [Smallanthus sonchifolius]|uniref:Uncharacterized protein n=1 Tax=Smallanthus sonchifolius TaxID=185202 RepID=A0ACB9DDT0_9ASTR|nr:hypothetical protein L1987_57912 [Smallanthus sonchifolius]